jgi:hypothetical protein
MPTADPADLGQAVTADRHALVSFLTSPIAVGTRVDYVVFCRGRSEPDRFEWTISDSGTGRILSHGTTSSGVMGWTPSRPGAIDVTVRVHAKGSRIALLSLPQRFRLPAGGLMPVGEPDTARELVEDLRTYVREAAAGTGPRGIPPRLLAAVTYLEALRRPREGSAIAKRYDAAEREGRLSDVLGPRVAGHGAREFIRTRELNLVADALRDLEARGEVSPFIDNSIGVCQLRPSTLAMTLGVIPWREATSAADRPYGEVRGRYLSDVPFDRKIDLFNLLRFPRTNIRASAMHLTALKNRPHRWPDVEADRLLEDELAVGVIASEYGRGPTMTPREDAALNRNGTSVVRLLRSPLFRRYFG